MGMDLSSQLAEPGCSRGGTKRSTIASKPKRGRLKGFPACFVEVDCSPDTSEEDSRTPMRKTLTQDMSMVACLQGEFVFSVDIIFCCEQVVYKIQPCSAQKWKTPCNRISILYRLQDFRPRQKGCTCTVPVVNYTRFPYMPKRLSKKAWTVVVTSVLKLGGTLVKIMDNCPESTCTL